MMWKRKIWIIALVALTIACAEKDEANEDEDEGDERQVGNIANLPAGVGSLQVDSGISTLPATVDPVASLTTEEEDTEAFNSNAGTLQIDGFDLIQSSKGISLGSDTSLSDFDGGSKAACEMVNRARGFLHIAAQPDAAACELAFILGDTEQFYDGEFHIIEITEEDDGEEEIQRYKFAIEGTKDDIESLTIYACEQGKQYMYMKKTVAEDNSYSIDVTRSAEPDNPQVDYFITEMVVSGHVDDAGNYVGLKQIDMTYSNHFSRGAKSYIQEQAIQSAENIQYVGAMTEDDTDPDLLIAFVNLIDKNTDDSDYQLEQLFLGDGAMAFNRKGDLGVEGWNGDSKQVDNTVGPYAKVEAAQDQLPSVPTPKTITYTAERTWDCEGEADLKIDDADLYAAILEQIGANLQGEDDDEPDICAGYELPQNSYLQCYQQDGN